MYNHWEKNTPQSQYLPANVESIGYTIAVHCLESGCFGKYITLGPQDFPQAISRASGCKIPALERYIGLRRMYFPMHPSSRQCADSFFTTSYWRQVPQWLNGELRGRPRKGWSATTHQWMGFHTVGWWLDIGILQLFKNPLIENDLRWEQQELAMVETSLAPRTGLKRSPIWKSVTN